MNRADRQRIIHGLQRDMAALERVTEIVRELIEDQLDQLTPGRVARACSGSTEDKLEMRCPDCHQEPPYHLLWCPWEGVPSLGPSQQLAGSGGGNEPPVLWCVSCGVHADDDGRCPNCDRVVKSGVVPLSKPKADLEERGTTQTGPKGGAPQKGRVPSHRKVVRYEQ